MKKFSLLVALILVIGTLAPAAVFAETTNTLLFNLDCTTTGTKMEDNTERQDIGQINYGGTTTALFKTNPQKEDTDKVLCMDYTAGNGTIYWGTKGIAFKSLSSLIGANSAGYRYAIFEFDVSFGNESSALSLLMSPTGKSGEFYAATVKASSLANGVTGGKATVECDSLGVNKWHRVRVALPINSTDDKLLMYVDNELVRVSDSAINNQGLYAQNNCSGLYAAGVKDTVLEIDVDNIKLYVGENSIDFDAKPVLNSSESYGTVSEGVLSLSKTFTVDEFINCASVDDGTVLGIYDSSLSTKKSSSENVKNEDVVVLSNESGLYSYYTVSKEYTAPELEDIGVPGTVSESEVILDDYVTAGALKTNVTAQYTDTVKVLSADRTEKSDTDWIENGDFLILSNADADTVFTITKKTAVTQSKLDNGSADWYRIYFSNTSGAKEIMDTIERTADITENADYGVYYTVGPRTQAPMKAEGDNAYKIKFSNSENQINTADIYLGRRLSDVYGATEDKTNGKIIIDFNIFPVSGNFNYAMRIKNGRTASDSIGFKLVPNGASIRSDSDTETLCVGSIEYNEWTHVAYEFSHDGGTVSKLYINNELVDEKEIASAGGFMPNQTSCSTATLFAANKTFMGDVELYVDDIVYSYCDAENGAEGVTYPKLSYEGYDASENVLTVESGTTAAELKAAVKTYYTASVNVADENNNSVGDDDFVSDGNRLVLAGNDRGAVTVFEISVSEIKITEPKIAVNGSSAEISFNYSNTLEATGAKIIAAAYSDDKLLALSAQDVQIPLGKDVISKSVEFKGDISEATHFKAIIVKDFGNMMPMCQSALYNAAE